VKIGDSQFQSYRRVFQFKNFVASQDLTECEALRSTIENWLNTQAVVFCGEGMQKLVPRYDKCLSSGGEHVER
jgi:hypothetical protein